MDPSKQFGMWTVPLEAEPETVSALAEWLSPGERARALRFRFPHLTRRFIVGRAGLRVVLAAYLDTSPATIAFDEGHAGKLHLRGRRLEFNVSHCDDLAIYGIGWGAAVGVDVERLRDIDDVDGIAERVFTHGERGVLASVPAGARVRTFFNCWTRKEAYVKAIGDGLLAPLQEFEVTLLPGDDAAIRHIGGDEAAAAQWSLIHLEPEAGFIGAFAARTTDATLQPLRRVHSARELLDRRRIAALVEGRMVNPAVASPPATN